uniref:Uncharacterized protein n=1 Tax=Anguilla anguilla TaxID=7936 RepID=A0A0E9WEE1_ANGAN
MVIELAGIFASYKSLKYVLFISNSWHAVVFKIPADGHSFPPYR